ncbi:MAG: hypothetical protein Q9196_006454 [Gyalolechia fulgens]
MPERLCGGTFRTRRGRKRKRGGVKGEEGLTYAERRQRRIERKFGKDGKLLGWEEEARVKLENGKKPKGKPRVAGSARGRELRAAAALARFSAQKEDALATGGSESESESDVKDLKPEKEALDLSGSKLLDSDGRAMVKVCEDEDQEDVHVKQEMDELQDLAQIESHEEKISRQPQRRTNPQERHNHHSTDHGGAAAEAVSSPIKHENTSPAPSLPPATTKLQPTVPTVQQTVPRLESICSVCSMVNEPSALVCVACAHVLQPQLMPGHWRCRSSTCEGSEYVNAGDCGICGACGTKKPGF